ncbi:MAG: hypothetical protein ACLTMD_04985 [Clostridium sp.]
MNEVLDGAMFHGLRSGLHSRGNGNDLSRRLHTPKARCAV